MKKTVLALSLLPIVITNSNSTKVETKVVNEVSGDNASVHTEINNQVNDKSVHIESTSPGQIEVVIDNDKVDIKTEPSTAVVTVEPKQEITISEKKDDENIIEETNEEEFKQEEEIKQVVTPKENFELRKPNPIFSFFKNIVYNIRKFWIFNF